MLVWFCRAEEMLKGELEFSQQEEQQQPMKTDADLGACSLCSEGTSMLAYSPFGLESTLRSTIRASGYCPRASFSYCFTMSHTVSKYVEAAVNASISTPVFAVVFTVE